MKRCILMLFSLLSLCFSNQVLAVAYAINNGNDTVFILNEATGQVTFTIPTDASPTSLALSPNGSVLYVANSPANTVNVINATSGATIATITGFDDPVALEVDPTGAYVAVANKGNNSVDFIDTSSNTIVAQATVGTAPTGVAIAPNAKTVYSCNSGSNNVSIIDVNDYKNPTVSAITMNTGTTPSDIITSYDGELLFVSNEGSNNVSVLGVFNSNTLSTVDVGDSPTSLAWHTNAVYVANSGNTTLSVLAVPNTPAGIVFTSDSRYAYVVNQGSNTVSVFDAVNHITIASIPVGGTPTDIAITDDDAYVYVCNSGANSVSIIATSSNTVVSTVDVDHKPVAIAISKNYAYTANNGSNNVSLIDLSTRAFSQNILLAETSPIAIASGTNTTGNEPIDFVCVVSQVEDAKGSAAAGVATVFVDTTKVVTLPTGKLPTSISIEPNGLRAAVTNQGDNTVSILNIDIATSTFSVDNHSTDKTPTDSIFWESGPEFGAVLLVVNNGSNNVIEYYPDVPRLDTQDAPQKIAIATGSTTEDDRVYVTNSGPLSADSGGDSFTIINPNAPDTVASITLEKTPDAITVAPNNLFAYVANTGNHAISILNGAPDITSISYTIGVFAQPPTTVNGIPTSVAVSPDGCVAVTYHTSNTITYGLPQNPCASTVYGFNLPTAIVFSSNPDKLFNTSASLQRVQGPWCTDTFAKLEWPPVTNTAQYEIYRNGLLIATLGSDQITYEDHNLAPSEEYIYILRVLTYLGATEDYSFEAIIP